MENKYDFDLLFIQKTFEVINTDNDFIVGNVLMFENTSHYDIVDDLKIPDYIIVMVAQNKILHITSKIIPKEEIEKYLLEKYSIKELIKL